MLWDTFMMTSIWVIWHECNSRIFSNRVVSMLHLIDSILYYVNFWEGNFLCL